MVAADVVAEVVDADVAAEADVVVAVAEAVVVVAEAVVVVAEMVAADLAKVPCKIHFLGATRASFFVGNNLF
jgi:hypothetical protein